MTAHGLPLVSMTRTAAMRIGKGVLMRNDTIAKIEAHRLVVIVRGVKGEDLLPTVQAMYDGGVRLLEITYSADGSIPDQEIARRIAALKDHFQDTMCIGAGTVLTEAQVELTAKAGGEFIISPNIDPKVIQATRAWELVSVPGALTPTEIQAAHLAGADFVKLFPIQNLGSSYVKAVRAPLSHVKLLAVGGVDDQNMKEFYRAGACGFGIGGGIVDLCAIAKGDFYAVTEKAKRYVEAVNAL